MSQPTNSDLAASSTRHGCQPYAGQRWA
jgi:hypothetical protein